MSPNRWKHAVAGAGWTVLTLFGGLIAGVVVGNAVFSILPGHLGDLMRIAASALPALAGMMAGGAAWGLRMGSIATGEWNRRMAWAGALGFAPVTVVLGIALQVIEPLALERWGAQIPLHRLFTILFVPSAFLIAAAGAGCLGIGLRRSRLALRLAWQAGTAAALAFLTVNLTMEGLGWQVGGPGAAERFTMLTVMFAGNLGAALAAGGLIGTRLAASGRPARAVASG